MMIPDWSQRSAECAAYPHRHWTAMEQEYCIECDETLRQDEVECNHGICDECLNKIRIEMENDDHASITPCEYIQHH